MLQNQTKQVIKLLNLEEIDFDKKEQDQKIKR